MKRWPWIALVVVLVVAAGVLALQAPIQQQLGEQAPASSPSQPAYVEEIQPVLVEAVQVVPRTLTERASYHGTLQPRRVVTLTPKASGRVAEIRVDVGDRVKAGQVLLRLETTEAEAQVRQAEAAVAAARAQLNRLLAGATDEELEQVRAGVRQAALQLEQARAELARIESLY
ncbi:MAG TPA: biotin/lipoyl-binding protein, partial [Limnochorda sp.]